MFEKFRLWLLILISAALVVLIVPGRSLIDDAAGVFGRKDGLVLTLKLVNPAVRRLSAEPSNRLTLQAEVKNPSGLPAEGVRVDFSVEQGGGEIKPPQPKTDSSGICLASYIPPELSEDQFKNGAPKAVLKAEIGKTGIAAAVGMELARVPIVFVHGYQADGSVFENLKDYLSSRGFETGALNYKSESGVAPASGELGACLEQQRMSYLSKGFQVSKFDIIAHSMGGLVARYYTSNPGYIRNDNVRKLIFLSVPHKGSPWASLGENLFKDQAVRDMVPDSDLLSKILPGMLNKGLNSSLQVGNIIAQYDEVVSLESASLEEWNIRTDVFDFGENSLTVDNIINGTVMEASNHRNILNNRKVFEKIYSMLTHPLPHPSVR